jgi:hypothetical protein
MTYREYVPKPSLKENTIMIPFFSLFAKDPLNKNDSTLLTQLSENQYNPKEFFIDNIVKMILNAFKTITMDG